MQYPKNLLVLFLLFTEVSFGQSNIDISHYTNGYGQYYRWVYDITQDEMGFIWMANHTGLRRYDGTEYVTYQHHDATPNSLSTNTIIKLATSKEHIWALGTDTIFNRVNIYTGHISQVVLPEFVHGSETTVVGAKELKNGDFVLLLQELSESGNTSSFWNYNSDLNQFDLLFKLETGTESIYHFSENHDGKVWLWSKGKSYYQIDLGDGSYETYQIGNPGNIISDFSDYPIDIERNLWFPTHNPNDEGSEPLIKFPLPDNIDISGINYLSIDNREGIWFYHEEGELFRIDTKSQEIERFLDPIFKSSVRKQLMRHYYVDNEGGYWNGHYVGAIRFTTQKNLFRQYFKSRDRGDKLLDIDINCADILELNDDNLIIKDVDQQLYNLELASGTFKEIPLNFKNGTSDIDNPELFSMVMDKEGSIWATSPGTILKIEVPSGNIEYFKSPLISSYTSNEGFNNLYFHRIFHDASDNLWVCDREGVFIFNKESGELVPLSFQHNPTELEAIFEFATYDPYKDEIYARYRKGILAIDCKNKTSSVFEFYSEQESYDLLITSIARKGNIFWLATNKGLQKYDIEEGSLNTYSKRNGLASNLIFSVIATDKDLWLSTRNGLIQFDPITLSTKNYTEEEGLINNEFNIWSYLRSTKGNIYFGGSSGVIGFNPEEFDMPTGKKGTIQISRFTSYDKQNNVIRSVSAPILLSKGIRVSHSEKNFSIKIFYSLFDEIQRNQISYYLEGLQTDWINNGNNSEIRFSHLPPGNYTLRVRANNQDNLKAHNELSIPIQISQVWYKRSWAFALYLLVLVILSFLYYHYQLKRTLEKQDALRIKELDRLKSKMYTNITHEFRTPLTVILGMNDVISHELSNQRNERLLGASEMINRNGKNLLELINQLLDLSKLESGKLKINYVQEDIIVFIKYLLASFQSYAAGKRIELKIVTDPKEIIMDFDKVKITQILNNLISNAIKHSPEDSTILVKVQEVNKDRNEIKICVQDEGVGIPEEQLEKIFDRFYQVDDSQTRKTEGTGIGLFLVRELVNLLDGSIHVKSKLNQGTSFIVNLPITNLAKISNNVSIQESEAISNLQRSINQPSESFIENDDLPLVLVVEDNKDVSDYIGITLKENYRVVFSRNGEEGIEKAIELIPDLIISDVMMPSKNGFELCNTLKNDERTSHIPIILLTAKIDGESKIAGLEKGADAYLAKPFNKKELLVRINNLLRIRAELQKRFSQNDFSKEIKTGKKELDPFLFKTKEIVLEHIDDENFSIPELCKLLFISRAQLHRKLIALTGHSASHLIRSVRLEKAQELLKDGQYNVTEVAYQVGFKTQAHFSRTFSEAMGVSPKEFQNQ